MSSGERLLGRSLYPGAPSTREAFAPVQARVFLAVMVGMYRVGWNMKTLRRWPGRGRT